MTETKIQYFINLIHKITEESEHKERNDLIDSFKSELENSSDFDINEKEYYGTISGSYHKTLLSCAAEENLTQIVQQVLDRYTDKISIETLTCALVASCKNDSNYDSAKLILQHLEKNNHCIKDSLIGMLNRSIGMGGCRIYALILEHIVKKGYGCIIDDQFTQWFKFSSNRKGFVTLILQHGNNFLSEEKINDAFFGAIKENNLEGLKLLTEYVEKKIPSKGIEELFNNGIENQNSEFLELVTKFKDKISSNIIDRIFSQVGYNKDSNDNSNVYENVKLVLQYGPVSKISEKCIQTVFISAALTENKKIFDLFLSQNINIPQAPLRALIERSDVTSDMKSFLQGNFLLIGDNLQQPPVINSNLKPTIITPPEQKQLINSTLQTVVGNEDPLEEAPIVNKANNDLQSEKQGHGSPITTHSSKQERFLGISPKGWTIIATFAAIGAVAGGMLGSYLLVLGTATAIATGTIAGAAIGGVMGCLANVGVDKCCGKDSSQAQAA